MPCRHAGPSAAMRSALTQPGPKPFTHKAQHPASAERRQDPRAVHDLRGPRSEKGPFLARYSRGASPNARLRGFSDARRAYLAEASSFWMHGGDMLPGRGAFPVRGPFGNASRRDLAMADSPKTHRGEILPLSDAGERISRAFCHRRAPGHPATGLPAASWTTGSARSAANRLSTARTSTVPKTRMNPFTPTFPRYCTVIGFICYVTNI